MVVELKKEDPHFIIHLQIKKYLILKELRRRGAIFTPTPQIFYQVTQERIEIFQ